MTSGINYHLETEGTLRVRVEGRPSAEDSKILQLLPKFPGARAAEVLRLLGQTRRLYWKGVKLRFDPFSSLGFFYEAMLVEGAQVEVRGKFTIGERESYVADCSWVYPCFPVAVIREGVLQFFSDEVEPKWVCDRRCYSLGQWRELSSLPPLQWKGSALTEPALLSTPCLLLTDRTGAFANLYLDYENNRRVSFVDLVKPSLEEMGWEKDLLETDFLRKMVDSSHYYCPLDLVGKSLTFLLELGWKVYDHLGRQVVRQKGASFAIKEEGSRFWVRGKVSYGEHQADLTSVMGTFNRRERFVSLDSHNVGLLDSAEWEKKWGVLSGEEIIHDALSIKKHQVGLLGSLLDDPDVACCPETVRWKERLAGVSQLVTTDSPGEAFVGTLFPYQKQGLDWLYFLYQCGLGGVLADEMGLGKTVQILALFSLLPPDRPILVVVPTTLVFNWQREAVRFLPSRMLQVYRGGPLPSSGIILTSYARLRLDQQQLSALSYACVVLDEGQYIKNPDSQIAKSARGLVADMRVVITGTPIENRWEDLWSLYAFLLPGLLEERSLFRSQMCAAEADARHLDGVRKKIRPFLLRRKKDEVALDLPEKILQTVWVEMEEEERSFYEEWMRKSRSGLLQKMEGGKQSRMEVLEAILRLRQLCAHPQLLSFEFLGKAAKYERLFADLAEVVQEGRKVLIYSQFTQMLRLIEKGVIEQGYRYVYLDGSTRNREEVVAQFQEDPDISLFLISLKAGGVGLNLTAADYVFIYDPWWNDAAEAQAIDRAHRLGRKGQVIARRYIAAETIEEKLMRLKAHKNLLAATALELGDLEPSQITMQDLQELLTP